MKHPFVCDGEYFRRPSPTEPILVDVDKSLANYTIVGDASTRGNTFTRSWGRWQDEWQVSTGNSEGEKDSSLASDGMCKHPEARKRWLKGTVNRSGWVCLTYEWWGQGPAGTLDMFRAFNGARLSFRKVLPIYLHSHLLGECPPPLLLSFSFFSPHFPHWNLECILQFGLARQ